MNNRCTFLLKIRLTALIVICNSMLVAQTLPTETSTLFSGSGNCQVCHQSSPNTFITDTDEDISPPTLWRSSMMGNSSHDPFWQAKVTAEVDANPHLKEIIEDKCATCHAPMGRTEAIHNGAQKFSFNEILEDELSLDGVSCTACHQIKDTAATGSNGFSGGYLIENDHVIYGPFADPFQQPMINFTGYSPVEAGHLRQSELCATCHTLFTPYVDNSGQVAGLFPEQTPYLEWLNSQFSSQGIECQDCHMEREELPQKITTRPPWFTDVHSPVMNHRFAGANNYMYGIMSDNAGSLGLNSSAEYYDSTENFTKRFLKEKTAKLYLSTQISSDTLLATVKVQNLAGHKFPTGFPGRRAFLHVLVFNDTDTLFNSGSFNQRGEIIGIDSGHETHYDVITLPEQVQVYESVMMDVDGNETYTLLRGADYIKDNRIPPKGFSNDHSDYENIKIAGVNNDSNFNSDGGSEGSGSDEVTYKIWTGNSRALWNISVRLYYQTLPPAFAEDLFTHQTEKVEMFKQIFNAAENTPVLIDSVSEQMDVTSLYNQMDKIVNQFELAQNYPNPFNPSTKIAYSLPVTTEGAYEVKLTVYDAIGKVVATIVNKQQNAGTYEVVFNAAELSSGVYYYRLEANELVQTRKLVLIK